MRDAKKLLGMLAAGGLLFASLGAVETLSQRRRQVEEMPAEKRKDLFRCEQQFRALTPQEQQRIRDLHDQIENDPDREKLRATMDRYCKWFETQPLLLRDKLLDKKNTLKERVATVKELVKKQGPTKNLRLDDKNRRVLAAWLERYLAEHESRFIEGLAQGPLSGFARLSPDRQRAALRQNLLRRWQTGGPNGQPPIADDEKARLLAGLSPELRSKLEAKKPGEQARIIAEWLRETASREIEASHELDEQLADFFEKTLTDQQRDQLMSLPGDEMYESLSKQYLAYLMKQSKSDEPPRGNRSFWPHGHHSGPPRGSGGRLWPESRDGKEPRARRDSKGSTSSD